MLLFLPPLVPLTAIVVIVKNALGNRTGARVECAASKSGVDSGNAGSAAAINTQRAILWVRHAKKAADGSGEG